MSEPIKVDENDTDTDIDGDSKKSKKSDFVSISSRILSSINFKMAIFLFFVGMLVFSDLFIDGFLSTIPDSVQGECTTTKGTMIQLTVFIICFLVLDLLVAGEWI
jgi:hypothetical protein